MQGKWKIHEHLPFTDHCARETHRTYCIPAPRPAPPTPPFAGTWFGFHRGNGHAASVNT